MSADRKEPASARGAGVHYGRGDLLSRLNQELRDDGHDPNHPSMASLAPYDHFHGRGLEATLEIAELVEVGPADHILDIGSGIGGPARYFAHRFGCRVTASRGISEGRIIPIEVLARRRP